MSCKRKIISALIIFIFFASTLFMFSPTVKGEITSKVCLKDFVQLTFDENLRSLSPAWCPDGSTIAYFAYAQGQTWYRNIWNMSAIDGSNKREMTFGNEVDEGPDYKKDGTQLLFIRYRGDGVHDIYNVSTSINTAPTVLKADTLAHIVPRYSHSGEKVVYYYGGAYSGINEIRMYNFADNSEETIFSSNYPNIQADWSLDDSKIVVTSREGLYLVDVTTHEQTFLLSTPLPTMGVRFSPCSNYILYSSGVYSDSSQSGQNLFLVDTQGNYLGQLTFDNTITYTFDWSPDGQWIVFAKGWPDQINIWKAKIITTEENQVFNDNFDGYSVGSFPSSGGWELVYTGAGAGYQVITNTTNNSPLNSLQLLGQNGWSANVQRTFSSDSPVIGYEVYMSADSNTGTVDNVASAGFWNLDGAPWGKRFAVVYFDENGSIYTEPIHLGSVSIKLGPYETNRWYKFTVIVDRTNCVYSVWMDDALVAQDISISDTYEINALMLGSGHAGVKVHFDDVRIFEGNLRPLFCVPEYLFGSLMVLIICFVSFFIHKVNDSRNFRKQFF
jgi:Tol biopolymer transport system component